jgi:glycogen operon protein
MNPRRDLPRAGATVLPDGIRFTVRSGAAKRIWVSLFDERGRREIRRLELSPEGDGVHSLFVPGFKAGTLYGLRADGEYDPARGLWFDPDKLLIDPYAVEIDRPVVYDPRLAARRGEGGDTAPLVPKAVATRLPPPVSREATRVVPGGLIYELTVRAFTKLHPAVPEAARGTISALAHPAVVRHLKKLKVSAVELMPITAWMDERHLAPLGLTNAWGYNPVSFMALDPRLAPGGLVELRKTVATLHAAGIGVILDLVFNHTGEGDESGPTLSFRGLDNLAYYRHVSGKAARLANDSGTGNTIATQHPVVRELVLDSLRHFVVQAGVDGFRFDLATVLGRDDEGFSPNAPLLDAIRSDPILADRVLIAEPWDIGPGGYQLGHFGPPFLEWNDRYRDDVRRFWRGDPGTVGVLATRLSGSSDVFRRSSAATTRTVNFIAAHDGMAIADLVRYEEKHNEANGEENRDGHNENFSWNNGIEGETDDPRIVAARRLDQRALLATLFASRGTIMLTAGDEFGRTQGGNNNAYAQDNEVTWLDWKRRDTELERYAVALADMRKRFPILSDLAFLNGRVAGRANAPDVVWLAETGKPMTEADWHDPAHRRLIMLLAAQGTEKWLATLINGDRQSALFSLPVRSGHIWRIVLAADDKSGLRHKEDWEVAGRSVVFMADEPSDYRD